MAGKLTTFIIGGVFVVAAAVILYWIWVGFGGEPSPRAQFAKVPDFALEDYTGAQVRLSDFQGKALVINVWAAWCPFCVEELKDFGAAQKEFKEQVAIIAIDRAEPLEVAKQFTDELGVTSELVFLLDPSDSFYQSIGGFSMPETIFADKKGNIRIHKRGPMKLPEIREKIQQIL